LSCLIGKGINCLDGSISKRYFILPKQFKVNKYTFHIRKKSQHKYHGKINSSKIRNFLDNKKLKKSIKNPIFVRKPKEGIRANKVYKNYGQQLKKFNLKEFMR
jgi:hypothetical protein